MKSGTCERCGKPWQTTQDWSRKRYCGRECAYAASREREARKRAETRAMRLEADEQARQAAKRWQPGPWHMPASWQNGGVPARPPRSMPAARQIAEYWHGREPFPIDETWPACFACKCEVDGWDRLERAHLVARVAHGLDGVQNLVLLCSPCHYFQPDESGQGSWFYIASGGHIGAALRRVAEHELNGAWARARGSGLMSSIPWSWRSREDSLLA